MARNQNPGALMNIEIGGKWTFIPQKYGIVGFDPSPYGWFMIVLPTYPVVKMCVISIIGQIMSIPEILSSTWLGHECVCNLSRLPIKVK
jgi:hypothetical protein